MYYVPAGHPSRRSMFLAAFDSWILVVMTEVWSYHGFTDRFACPEKPGNPGNPENWNFAEDVC